MDNNSKQRRSVTPPGSSGAIIPQQQSRPGTSRGLAASATAAKPKQKDQQSKDTGPSNSLTAIANRQHKKGGKGSFAGAQAAITLGARQYHHTKIYLRGRDAIYPDAAALARFNTWVTANSAELDPAEQFVCHRCGHVDFTLCACRVERPVQQQVVVQQAAIIPHRERHFEWSFRPIEALKKGFVWPKFDTHSQSDEALWGFSNHHISDDLLIEELFSYLCFHMQTAYLVNGREDRALRLSHTHKLAQRWLTMRGAEDEILDQHYCVRVRFTIQRACDNMQNSMLYGSRTPAQNFGLAWLPQSRHMQLLIILLALFAACNLSTTIGLFGRLWVLAVQFASALVSVLNYLAVTVRFPDVVRTASASTPPPGNMPVFLCLHTDYDVRWRNVNNDANAETLSCTFLDWVMAGMNEVYLSTLETWTAVSDSFTQYREETCSYHWGLYSLYQWMWTSSELIEALTDGRWTPWDVIKLWWADSWTGFLLWSFRC